VAFQTASSSTYEAFFIGCVQFVVLYFAEDFIH